jgi:hypothetical protein
MISCEQQYITDMHIVGTCTVASKFSIQTRPQVVMDTEESALVMYIRCTSAWGTVCSHRYSEAFGFFLIQVTHVRSEQSAKKLALSAANSRHF